MTLPEWYGEVRANHDDERSKDLPSKMTCPGCGAERWSLVYAGDGVRCNGCL